jgi:hypothetical protein
MTGEAVRLKLEKDSFEVGREGTGGSEREGVAGAGEVGLLMGLRKDGVLRAYISSDEW